MSKQNCYIYRTLHHLTLWLCLTLVAVTDLEAAPTSTLSLSHSRAIGEHLALATEHKAERLEVIICYGRLDELILSGKSSGRVKRYRTDALQSEAVPATFAPSEGGWRITSPTAGYGYYVEQEGELANYIYIIDYEQHRPALKDLSASPSTQAPCSDITLDIGPTPEPMIYHTPSGVEKILPWRLEISHNDLRWDEQNQSLQSYLRKRSVDLSTNTIEIEAALVDTEYQIGRDIWSEQLGITTKLVNSPLIEAQRIEVHASVRVLHTTDEIDLQRLSAPATLDLSAIGSPAIAKYHWRIERIDGADSEVVMNYIGAHTEHTLTRSGLYRIRLECINRKGSCVDNSFETELRITESSLEVPNAFSPGSSPGVNDTFRVLHKSLIEFQGKIFSPTGQELYRWSDPNTGWDGTYRGQLVPTGGYYYAIDALGSDGIRYQKRGVVNILRSDFE